MATTKKQPVKKSPAKKAVAKKVPVSSAIANVVKKQAAKAALLKKATAKKESPKNAAPNANKLDAVSTLEHQLKSKTQDFACLSNQYCELLREHLSLKKSFSMLKDNYEREKNRLDKVIDASLNNSKALEAITNSDPEASAPEGDRSFDYQMSPLKQ